MGGDGDFGTALSGCRRSAGLSQQELAERSGLTVRTISNLERGRTRWPHPGSVQRLADALGLDDDQRQRFIASATRRLAPPASAPAAATGDDQVREVPRQLPAGVRHFAGRAAQLAELRELLDRAASGDWPTVAISAIGGTAGAGKTALAVHWAHLVADRFPDGQLYADLRGWGPSADPVSPAESITRFLAALGVPADQAPADAEARQDLYRSLLASRRMLIVLDNARDVAQVRPLLPGGSSCMVLVTSRGQLASLVALEAAHPVPVDVVTAAEGRELLARRLGAERVAAEPEAVSELVELCAGLPLALAIAAARAALHPGMSLAALSAGLRDTRGRLAALDAGEGANVAAVFSWSYDQLPGPARRMFRMLGIHPGPDVTAAAAASLAAASPGTAQELLDQLAEAGLVTEHVPGRYRFHDLLRRYAAGRAQAEDSRSAAIGRALDHYLHSAYAADKTLRKFPATISLSPPRPGVTPEPARDFAQAMAWFDAERDVLSALLRQAASSGFDTHGWQLPLTLLGFYDRIGHTSGSLALQQSALAAATRLGDRLAQAQIHRRLGSTFVRLGAYQDAEQHYQRALDLCEDLGDRAGLARAHLGLGFAADHQGRYREALGHAGQVLALSDPADDPAFHAVALSNVGWCHARLGEYGRALGYCQRALGLHQDVGDQYNEAHAYDSLGYVHRHLGQHAEAVASYQRAIALFRQLDARADQAVTLDYLGDAHHWAGDSRRAASAWQESLAIFEDLHHPSAKKVRGKLRP